MASQEVNHETNIGVHFIKIILQTTLQHGKLRVPISFVRRHWKGITNPITLRLPNSSENKVFWEKTSDCDVWFCNGWKEFANYLSLGDSQLLVFQYQGNSLFNVIGFGKCGLEIKYPLRETSEKFEEVEESNSSLKIIEAPSLLPSKRSKTPSQSSKVCKKRKVQTHPRYPNFKNMDNGSSCDERSRVLYEKVKKKFKSDKEFFTSMIHKTYIERDILGIPIEFAKTHDLHRMEGRNVTLFVDQERTWNVDLKCYTSRLNKRFTLVDGWSKFYADNNLKFGDVCVFILNKCKGTISFQVVIFSLEKDMSTPYFQDQNDDTTVIRNMKHDQEQKNLTSKIEEALNKAKNYKSNNPFFTVVITYTYVNQYMYIPVDFVQKNMKKEQSKIVLRVLDDERTWIVKYCQRKIITGWKTFAADNHLKVGDVCVFELVNVDNEVVFDVRIFRGRN